MPIAQKGSRKVQIDADAIFLLLDPTLIQLIIAVAGANL
jgi:hypothetical protein